MICNQCGETFEPTSENPGTTQVGGYADENRIEIIHLCHECVTAFHTLPMEEQQLIAESVKHG